MYWKSHITCSWNCKSNSISRNSRKLHKQEPADLITVANGLKEKNQLESIGGAAYLAAISDAAPIAVNAVHYARIIRGKASLRQLITSSSQIIEKCLMDKGDFEQENSLSFN